MEILGDKLKYTLSGAKSEIVLISPFIKVSALGELIKDVTPQVPIKIVTRWRPDEILSGVSDVEIFELCKERNNYAIWLNHNLHAKFYRVDSTCYIGSANLTNTGLGWALFPNIELLHKTNEYSPLLKDFEQKLFVNSRLVTEKIYHNILSKLEKLQELEIINKLSWQNSELSNESIISSDYFDKQSTQKEQGDWVPHLRNPEELFKAYSGSINNLTTATKENAHLDLIYFGLAPGLPESIFNGFIGSLLLQMPIVISLDNFVSHPRRFGEVTDFLNTLPISKIKNYRASYTWQTLMRWLLYFLSERYECSTANYSEIFKRKP